MFKQPPTPSTQNMHNTMMNVCESMKIPAWSQVKPMVANELNSFILMLTWIKQMQEQQLFTKEQARIHIDIQRTTMRTRLMALPEIDILTADHLLNNCVDAIRKEIYEYLGWVLV
jgi:hypothetical protein